jgi:2-methylcitrate dehydratase PrpD
VQKNNIDPATIQNVTIRVPRATYTNPGLLNVAPYATPLQARISAKFTVAAALLGRPIHEHDFYANTGDPDVLALSHKIDLEENREDNESAYMQIVCDGKTYDVAGTEAETLRPTTEKIIAKFKRLTANFLGTQADAVLDAVLHLDSIRDIREVTDLLRAEKD